MEKIKYYLFVLLTLISSALAAQDNGLSFDGVDDYVAFPSNTTFNSTRTFEAWIYPTSTSGVQTIAEWTDGVDNVLRFYMNNGQLFLLEDDGFNGGTVSGVSTVTANQWNHVAFVETGSGFIFYVDGVTDFVGFPTGSAGPTPIFNLGSIRSGFNYFAGIIDEVRVWSTELTQATIESQRFSELTGAEAGLIAYYQFNETSGTVLPDLTTNTIDGTLLNGLANSPPADGTTNGPVWVASAALPDLFIVTNTNNSGVGSLRWCLDNANATAGANTITFDFAAVPPGSQINIDSELTLSDNFTTINADQGSDGKPDIILASGNAGINGFRITGSNNTISGFNLIQFANGINFPAAIKITGAAATGNVITANYIGTDLGGNAIAFPGNYRALRIDNGASNNQIGNGSLLGQNVISNNQLSGIQVADGTSNSNRILGNIIGLDASGATDLGNGNHGIEITNATGSIIGASGNGRNIISGNGTAGIEVNNGPNTIINNNYIGTDLSGSADLGNDNEGINIAGNSSGSFIGDGAAGNGNLISGNSSQGVLISSSDISILGNIIGLNAAGNAVIQNSNVGLDVAPGGTNTIIGNGTVNGRNIISGNSSHGVRIREGSNSFEGNYVGLGADGIQLLGNNGIGVFVTAGTDTYIGGNTAGAGNVISGNTAGVSLSTGPNFVYGNIIGLDATATIAKPNSNEGVRITANGDANEIGDGTLSGANIIAGNTDNGVLLSGLNVIGNAINVNYIGTNPSGANLGNGLAGVRLEAGTTGNSIPQNIIAFNQTGILATGGTTQLNLWTQNSIYSNATGISIELGAQGGVSPPVITSVPADGAVTGTAAPLALVDIYADAADQGEYLFGVATADASGNWTCTCLGPTASLPAGLDFITATQTDPGTNNSSEFSAPFATPPAALPFVTTWQSDNPGSSNNDQITIPHFGGGSNYNIYWEEVGNPTNNGTTSGIVGTHTITFPNPGTYRVEISGAFFRIYFNNTGDNDKILSVEQWGDIAWTSMSDAFEGCTNLTVPAADAPDLSNVTDMSRMFSGAESITESLDHWDVSNITAMASTFRNAVAFNGTITNWDVSNVVDFFQCFSGATAFNQPLNWTINNTPGASVTMLGMFSNTRFNQDLSAWDVSEVVSMSQMFFGNDVFNENITNWDVRKVTSFSLMFRDNTSFNQDISNWQLNSALSISQMFLNATSFNQPIGNWGATTGNITDMSGTFRSADAFNQPIDAWDVSSVTTMDEMFTFNNVFNQDLNSWDVSSVQSVRRMFWSSAAFNGNIADWNLSSCIFFTDMFLTAQAFNQPLNWTLNTNASANIQMEGMFEGSIFNQDISSWDVSRVQNMRDMFRSNTVFNGSVSGWDVTNVQIFSEMFRFASNFDQSLGTWDIASAVLMDNMLQSSGMSTANYDATLIGWNALPSLQSGVTFGAGGLTYCTAEIARDNIISAFDWSIIDAGLNCAVDETNGVLTTDYNALVALYNATDGPNWTTDTNWLTAADVSTWFGVVTSGNRVREVNLNDNNLVGTLPPEIGDLSSAIYFRVRGNTISGTIPVEVGNMSSIIQLWLYDNQLTGTIPSTLANILALRELRLDQNQLTGAIPPELGNLPNLWLLFLYSNNLTGPVPITAANFPSLRGLDVNNNQLSGPIPPDIVTHTSIDYLLMGNNQFTGTIPVGLGNLTNLNFLQLHSNQLTGLIPSDLGSLNNLIQLYLYNNQLSGAIPPELGNLSSLEQFLLNQNELSGSIPVELGNLSSVLRLRLHTNQLSGTIPMELGNLSTLTELELSRNQLTGTIPAQLGNLSNAELLLLFDNQLDGTVPAELGNLLNLTDLRLDQNQLIGTIPAEIGNLLNLTDLRFDRNQMTGAIPSEIANLTLLTSLSISLNSFTDLPDLSALVNMTNMQAHSNNFEFDDLEPNVGIVGIAYIPQKPLPALIDQSLTEGSTLDLTVEVGGTANQYQWLQNDVLLTSQTSNNLVIPNLTVANEGIYQLFVTSTLVPGLTLEVPGFNLTVNPSAQGQFNLFEGADTSGNPVSVGQSDVDVGSTVVGVNIDRDFTIQNSESTPVNISSISSSDPAFEIVNVPATIAPGTTELFTVRLIANAIGQFSSTISINSDFAPFTFSVIGEVAAEEPPSGVRVYNALSPNNDGKHDYLEIEFIDLYPGNRVLILNRWGDIVYEANGYNNSTVRFEGLSNNGSELPPGTYYYQIDLGNGAGAETGFFALRR